MKSRLAAIIQLFKAHQVRTGKYLMVGVAAFLVDYGLFIVLTKLLKLPLFLGNTTALICGFLVSFFGNRSLVFHSNKTTAHYRLAVQVALYGVLLAINSVLTYSIITVLVQTGFDSAIGKVVSMVFIVVWNFVIYQKIIFKSKPSGT